MGEVVIPGTFPCSSWFHAGWSLTRHIFHLNRQVGNSQVPLSCDLPLFSRVYPEWDMNTQFINEHLNHALELDAKLSSHPIEVDCPDANQVNQVREPARPVLLNVQLNFCSLDFRCSVVFQRSIRYVMHEYGRRFFVLMTFLFSVPHAL